jgi:ribonuclease HII
MPTDPTLDVERDLFANGARCVIGIDEVGRGAIAGPVVVGAAMIRVAEPFPEGLRDSKILTAKRREALVEPVRDWVVAVATGEATAGEIDEFGIVPALSRAAERAIARLQIAGHDLSGGTILLDGTHNWLKGALVPAIDVMVRAKADRDCAVVAAASVEAKVYRDSLMVSAAGVVDLYGWASNKGYGSSGHFDAIAAHGITALHRASWISSVHTGAGGE